MKSFQIPFSNYDIFGYILPGSLFLLGLLCIFPDNVSSLLGNLNEMLKNLGELKVGILAALSLALIAALYFIGHIVGCIGHLFYDRLVVRYLLGYPFYHLLGWDIKSVKKARYGTLVLIFFGALFLILPIAFLLFKNISATKQFLSDYRILFVIGMIFVIAEVLVCFFVKENVKKGTDEYSLQQTDLCDRIVYIFRKSTATDKGVNVKLKNYFEVNLTKKTELQPKDFEMYNSDIYWIANIELSKNPVHSAKLSGWLDMIGCLRNYSCAFLFLAIIESFRLWECIVHAQQNLPPHAILLTIAFTLLSVLLFSRFWVMYYAYYSKYIIRVYALENLESKENDKEKTPSKGVVYAAWDYDLTKLIIPMRRSRQSGKMGATIPDQ